MGYRRDKPVIERLSLAVDNVGVVRLSGANGSGKSTFIEAASGYLRPWDGQVLVAGLPASSDGARRVRRVCRSSEALYPSMTARDHLTFAARCSGTDPREGHRRAEAYGMAEWMDSRAESLSTGNRRKLWLVMCTTGEFRVALLDEPFDGLDTHGVHVLCDEIATWAQDRSVMVVAHSLPMDLPFSRVIHLHDLVKSDDLVGQASGTSND